MTLPNRRIVILRTSRDTLVLIASTVCVTLALAYAVRQRPAPTAAAPEQQVWAGQLAELAPGALPPAKTEPMTSASLVVPKAALALPPALPPSAPAGRSAKPAICDAQPCPTKAVGPAAPARQKLAAVEPEAAKPAAAPAKQGSQSGKGQDRRFALSDLNPLPHLPDAVRKPFSYAGNKISGLMDWF